MSPTVTAGKACTADVGGGAPLRLHLNESPYGPPPGVREAVGEEFVKYAEQYPDAECTELVKSIAGYLGVPEDMVTTGNGVDELVLLAALAYAGPGADVVLTASTFPGYLWSSSLVSAKPRVVALEEQRVATAAVVDAIKDGADLAFVCNPHNPTGTLLPPDEIDEIVTAAEAVGCVPVIDEAYMDFVGGNSAIDQVRAGRQAVVLRSFSKAWSMPSIRVGYAVGPAELIQRLQRAGRPLPFSVNRLAQRAVPVALRQQGFLEKVRQQTSQAREVLFGLLLDAHVDFVPSVTNFVMISTGEADSTEVSLRLANEHGILVRDLAMFDMPGRIRITLGTPEEMKRCCAALTTVLKSS